MRISVLNWQTSVNDVQQTVAGAERALARMRSALSVATHR
jgi:hypothetical protein